MRSRVAAVLVAVSLVVGALVVLLVGPTKAPLRIRELCLSFRVPTHFLT